MAIPKLVITQVPWPGLTPKSPEMAGIDTLAIEESSTFMNVAKDKDNVPNKSAVPYKGGIAAGEFAEVKITNFSAQCDPSWRQ